MRTKYLLYSLFATATLTLASCDYNEDHFPGFDELTRPTDIGNDTLTFAASDYKAIANVKANIDLATSKDPEGETYLKALKAVGTNGYFTEDAPALWYMPAYLNQQYPYLDNNSKITIYYKEYVNLPEYLKDFNGITNYQLSTADYRSVWGESVSATYLTPSTVGQIPNILANAISNPKEGDMKLVNYVYSETEPSTGEGEIEEPITDIATIITSSVGTYTASGTIVGTYSRGFMLNDGTASILVYLNAPANYSVGDVVTITGTTSSYSGLYQFTQNSEITWIEHNKSFTYPTATTMNGAQMDAWTNNATVQYVSITGELSISNNYYNLLIDGAEHQGSISYPANGLVDAGLNGQEVTVTGYLIGYSNKYVNIMATSVVAAGTTSQYTPIGLIANASADTYQAKGTVVALYNRGFLLNDGTGSILVYLGSENGQKVGDVVTVEGSTSSHAGFMQFGNSAVVTTVSSSSFNYPAARVLSGTDMDAYLTAPYVAYITYEGTLSISGNYYNVEVDGAGTAIGSISYPLDGLVPSNLNGKKVIVTGYAIGVSSGKYVNTMATSVVEANTTNTKALLQTANISTRAAADVNASAVYRYNGSRWTTYSTKEAEIAVLQPKDYDLIGYSTIKYPGETLPIYLKQAYPYAKADDIVAVVYTNDDGNIVATEFIYDGATWTETTIAQDATIVFVKTNGDWVEAKVYYSSTLLNGESGGFTIQDIALDGLERVWSLEPSYGWKASGYLSSNKTTESWLVSPEIDLSKAIAPALKFDVCINFLKAKTVDDYFRVKISTDYSGDVTTATWDNLTIPEWPTGDSYDFMTIENIDLSTYVGQKIYLSFQYLSDTETAVTAEVKNLSIQE